MSRKGRLEEIFSKALYYDDPNLYTIRYRDRNSIVRVSLIEFLRISENFQLIPASRILSVTKEGFVLYARTEVSRLQSS